MKYLFHWFLEICTNYKVENLLILTTQNCTILDDTLVYYCAVIERGGVAILNIRFRQAIAGSLYRRNVARIPNNIVVLTNMMEHMANGVNIIIHEDGHISLRTENYIPKFSWGDMLQIPFFVKRV